MRKESVKLNEQMTNDQGLMTIDQAEILPQIRKRNLKSKIQNLIFPLTILLCWLAVLRLVIKILLLSGSEKTGSFIGYYAASKVLAEGQIGPQVYDNAWFIAWAISVSRCSRRIERVSTLASA